MRVPSSTYRLQISPEFELSAAAEICDYLAALGVGAVYCSPLLTAASGSEHGYDVVDHDEVDPARGGAAGWQALLTAARANGLDVIVDIVPNHMGVDDASENRAWWDVLRLGRESPYARWFDIDWSRGRILVPVLGDGEPVLEVVDDELRYFEHRFPIAPGTGEGSPDEVHARQHYELANFRRADDELNYRRFFAVSSLAALRVEDADVFAATHREIVRWVREDGIAGLRIDHPDGLADPLQYLERLQDATGGCWITVEKILEPGETLPDWPVAGTTGYDALTEVTNVIVDSDGAEPLDDLYREMTSDQLTFADHVQGGKRQVVESILRAEVLRLARLGGFDPEAAIAELLVAFPVYRSYLPIGLGQLAVAARVATERRPDLTASIDRLLPRLSDPADEIAIRFQQTSGAVMAKGVEDTAYYRYSRMVSLNEVGGDPARIGAPLATFHVAQRHRQDAHPDGMTTLTTHDTKRSEDVRARLAVLAEIPAEWEALVRELMTRVPMPNRGLAYLLWQTFVGAGLIERDRMHEYAEKAMREGADETHWIDPSVRFERLVQASIDRAYDYRINREAIEAFCTRAESYGWTNSLSQKLIQLTMPGVPDVYEGTELWDDSLVDPDNRRAVDFPARARRLAELDAAATPPPIDASGAAKLWLVSRVLRLRRDRPELFAGYSEVDAIGSAARHLVAFDRGGAITLATRLPARLERRGGWAETALELSGRVPQHPRRS